ncbi:helix-turn-helix domain-containing protein [Rhodobacter capsulatus]|uniref:helix-turn-helix domain-containing protein n=1 Tax=Rhodobacter capsulatus TaxID=1061 RepID=UPI004028A894
MAAANEKPFGGTYQKKVKALAVSRGIKGATLAILSVLLDHCNWETGIAFPPKKMIAEKSGASPNTVDRAITALKSACIIEPVAYRNGGRHRAVCYKFGLGPWGGEAQPKQEKTPPKMGEKPPQKWGKNPPQNGGPNHEVTFKEHGKGAAGRGHAMQEAATAVAPEPEADLQAWIAFAYRAGAAQGEPFAQVRQKALNMQALARGAAVEAA